MTATMPDIEVDRLFTCSKRKHFAMLAMEFVYINNICLYAALNSTEYQIKCYICRFNKYQISETVHQTGCVNGENLRTAICVVAFTEHYLNSCENGKCDVKGIFC